MLLVEVHREIVQLQIGFESIDDSEPLRVCTSLPAKCFLLVVEGFNLQIKHGIIF